MRPQYINVRARSANEVSGTEDWPLVAPLACFPKDEEDIADYCLVMPRIIWGNLPEPGLGSRTVPCQTRRRRLNQPQDNDVQIFELCFCLLLRCPARLHQCRQLLPGSGTHWRAALTLLGSRLSLPLCPTL